MLKNIEFANPEYFYLFIGILLMIVWYWFNRKKTHTDVQISDTQVFEISGSGIRPYLYFSLRIFRLLALCLLIIALARPQTSTSRQNVSIEGIDIIMALDVSGSMLAQDLKPDRLEAAKIVASDFFDGRPDDRIGLVIFSGETFTQCPLTTDHSIIKNLFKDIKSGMIKDGTAIGDGLATAVSRLRESEAISKVIILITDGENNAGSIDPITAAEIAKLYGIRVYAIGIGTTGMAPYPVQSPFGGITYQNVEVKIDEELLQQVTKLTNGKYFRATSNKKLEEIYKEIDRLEKSKIDVTEFRRKNEKFLPLVVLAFIILSLELIFRKTIFKTLP